MGREDDAPEFVVGVDCLDGLVFLDGLFLFLRSRKIPEVDVLVRSPIAKELFSELSCDVKARERVRGRKKPNFPRGMERPCTT